MGNPFLSGFAAGLQAGFSEAPMQASSIFTGSDGLKPRLAWARYSGAPYGRSGAYGISPGGTLTRDRNLVTGVTLDLALTNPVISTIIENLTTLAVGQGLTLSSKLNRDELKLTKEQARDLSNQIERYFTHFALNPHHEVSGRFDLHAVAAAAFRSWLLTGEALLSLDWRRDKNVKAGTRYALLDPRQVDTTICRTERNGSDTFNGVQFSKDSRLEGYWIRKYPMATMNMIAMPEFYRAQTAWGRDRIVLIAELIDPRQVRGISPLASVVTPAHERSTLAEFELAAALIQTQFAMTVESGLPSRVALGGLNPTIDEPATDLALCDMLAVREQWYSKSGIRVDPGTINHLAPGDKLVMHANNHPNGSFDSFDKSLTRTSAKAAGSSYEDTSGDYSQTTYSASRLALGLPHRINMRRRRTIVERIYRTVFHAVMEEAFATGAIVPPAGSPKFYAAEHLWLEANFLGQGAISPDPRKQVEADIAAIKGGLTTISDVLAESGRDFEQMLEQRIAEADQLREAGFAVPWEPVPGTTPNALSKQKD